MNRGTLGFQTAAERPKRPDLAALRARLPARPLTRFAPSPTGHLHLGHVVNALYVWGVARALDGRVLLRLEDHDRSRWRAEYEASILDDLEWLGLEPDDGALTALRAGPSRYRQSDAASRYVHARARLRLTLPVYACACSRKDLAQAWGGPAAPNDETPYPGTCRRRGLAEAPGRGLRVVMAPGEEGFDDAMLGPQRQEPARQCGDLLIRDRHGQWTYQFAVTVDDLEHGVDLVIRGEDLLASTGRQVRLARALGRPTPPVFLHHPLLFRRDGHKLSKSQGDAGVRELRAAGCSPEEVLGRAAAACGLLPAPRPLAAADLDGLFE